VLFEALRDSVRYPVIWLAGAGYAVPAALQLVLTLQGETFFSVRLAVLEYLALPFLLAGVYGVLREADSSPRRLLDEGIRNYFRVLLPALVVAFAAVLLLFALFVPLSLLGGTGATDLAIGAAIVVLIPVAVLLSLYDTAACFEGLGVFASLRRSVALVLAHVREVVGFLLTTFGVLFGFGFVLAVGWTTAFFQQLEPLGSMPPAEVAAFEPGQLAAMIGPLGIALGALAYGLFWLFAFVLVTTYKAQVFQSVSTATPPAEPTGEYDEKGRYYRY
jgi:hypothetical protein